MSKQTFTFVNNSPLLILLDFNNSTIQPNISPGETRTVTYESGPEFLGAVWGAYEAHSGVVVKGGNTGVEKNAATQLLPSDIKSDIQVETTLTSIQVKNSTPFAMDVVPLKNDGSEDRSKAFSLNAGFYQTQPMPARQACRCYISGTAVELSAFIINTELTQNFEILNTVVGVENFSLNPVDAYQTIDGTSWSKAGSIAAKSYLRLSNYAQNAWRIIDQNSQFTLQETSRLLEPQTITVPAELTHRQVINYQQWIDAHPLNLTFINQTPFDLAITPLTTLPDGTLADVTDKQIKLVSLASGQSPLSITVAQVPYQIREFYSQQVLGYMLPQQINPDQRFTIKLPDVQNIPVSVQFVNETLLSLVLFRVDVDGRQMTSTDLIAPQTDATPNALLGQTWAVRDQDSGMVLQVETITRQQRVVRITTANLRSLPVGEARKIRFLRIASPNIAYLDLQLFTVGPDGKETFKSTISDSQEYLDGTVYSTWVVRETISKRPVKMLIVSPFATANQDYFIDYEYPQPRNQPIVQVTYINRTNLTVQLKLTGSNAAHLNATQSITIGNIVPGDRHTFTQLSNMLCVVSDYASNRPIGLYISTDALQQDFDIELSTFISPYRNYYGEHTPPANYAPFRLNLTNQTDETVDAWTLDDTGAPNRAVDTSGQPISIPAGSRFLTPPSANGVMWQFTRANTTDVVSAFISASPLPGFGAPDNQQFFTIRSTRGVLLRPDQLPLREGEVALFSQPGFQGTGRLLAQSNSHINLQDIFREPLQTYPYSVCAISPVSTTSSGNYVLTTGWGIDGRGNTPVVYDLSGRAVLPYFARRQVGPISVGAFSPDGKWVLTGGYDGTVLLWPLTASENQGEAVTLRHRAGSYIMSVAFSPDNTRILTAGYDQTAVLWDFQGNRLATCTHDYAVSSAVFSPDGQSILTAMQGNSFTGQGSNAFLWNLAGQKIRTLLPTTSDMVIRAIFWTPGQMPVGLFVLLTIVDSASHKPVIKLFNLLMPDPLLPIGPLFSDRGANLAVSPDQTMAISGGADGTNLAIVWAIQTGTIIKTFNGYTGGWLGFTPDSKNVFIGDKRWDLASNEIKSLKVGPRTAFTLFGQTGYQDQTAMYTLDQTDLTLANPVASFDLSSMKPFDEPGIANHSSLVDDFRLKNGQIETFTNYRTVLTVPLTAISLVLTADEPVTVTIKDISYDIGPSKPVVLTPNRFGKVIIDLPATGLHPPMLLAHTSNMPEGEFNQMFPAGSTHKKIATMPDKAIFDNWNILRADPGEAADVSHCDAVQRSMRNLARTVQYTYHGCSCGFHHKRQLTAHNMEHAHWRVDMSAPKLAYQPLTTAYVKANLQNAPRASQDTSRQTLGLFAAFEADLLRARQILVHTAHRLGDDLVETGKAVVGDVVEAAENMGKHLSDSASKVGEDIVHGNIVGAATDLRNGVFSVGSDLATESLHAAGDLVDGGINVLGEVIEAVPKLVVVTLDLDGTLVQYVLDHTGMVGKMLEHLIGKAHIQIDRVLAWLKEKLIWTDILATQTALNQAMTDGLTGLIGQVPAIKASADIFLKSLSARLAQALSESPNRAEISTSIPKDTHNHETTHHINWLLSKMVDHDAVDPLGALPAAPANLTDVINTFLQKAQQAIGPDNQAATQALAKARADMQTAFDHPFGSIDALLNAGKELAKALAFVLIDLVGDLIDAIFDIATVSLTWLRDSLSTPIQIPFLTAFYSFQTRGGTLTLLNLVTLVVATPLTVMSHQENQPLIFTRETRDTAGEHYYQLYPQWTWARAYAFTHFALFVISVPANVYSALKFVPRKGTPKLDLVIGVASLLLNGLAQLSGNPLGNLTLVAPRPVAAEEKDIVKAPNYWTHVIWYYQFGELAIQAFEMLSTVYSFRRDGKIDPPLIPPSAMLAINDTIATFNTAIGVVHMGLFIVLAREEHAKGTRLNTVAKETWEEWKPFTADAIVTWRESSMGIVRQVYAFADNSQGINDLLARYNAITTADGAKDADGDIKGYKAFWEWFKENEFAKKTSGNILNTVPEMGAIFLMPKLVEKTKGRSLWGAALTNVAHIAEGGIMLNRKEPEA
ncbi:WD40 repeat domain-containing protein [Spirosoma spitsbergense]|uniref:WD40 repeat domain-containing protein n=1 Tax=Spirosoma spitsbergense TaxID=431554 RepID=UPI000381A1DF|nr:hypothetical protein [Spirosoma spitsbergense]